MPLRISTFIKAQSPCRIDKGFLKDLSYVAVQTRGPSVWTLIHPLSKLVSFSADSTPRASVGCRPRHNMLNSRITRSTIRERECFHIRPLTRLQFFLFSTQGLKQPHCDTSDDEELTEFLVDIEQSVGWYSRQSQETKPLFHFRVKINKKIRHPKHDTLEAP